MLVVSFPFQTQRSACKEPRFKSLGFGPDALSSSTPGRKCGDVFTAETAEMKRVSEEPVYETQFVYLKLSGCHVGLLINSNVKQSKTGPRRLVNELPE